MNQTANSSGPKFKSDIIVIVGGLGSGKSEIAVNLARDLAKNEPGSVTIADLDIHNPYFRSREAADQLESFGVKSLNPPGDQVHADLPIIIPDIAGAIKKPQGKLILDVGGDDTGARVLSSLNEAFTAGSYDLLLILNANRPFTATVPQAEKMIDEIEASSRLKITGIIANAHLMDQTTIETITEGIELAREVAQARKLPILAVSVTESLAPQLEALKTGLPLLRISRLLLKPWEKETAEEKEIRKS